MSVISIIIVQSSEEVVSGIPKVVSISTNIPASIFFTLDGSVPNLFSTIYTAPIFLPFNSLVVVLSILATDGVNTSPVIVQTYQTSIVDQNARLPHSSTTAKVGQVIPDDYPFGDAPFQPRQQYLNPADSGITVYNPTLPAISNAWDGQGEPTSYTNHPYNTLSYQIPYTDRNAEGESGPLIGTIPAITTIYNPPPPEEESSQFTNTFDPRALVIFQDFKNEDPNDPAQINSQFMSFDNPDKERDGSVLTAAYSTGSPPPSGTFIRAHYNPRTNEITHYYRDSWSGKWLISTSPYQPTGSFDGNMATSIIGSRSLGSNYVYEWIPLARRILF